MFPVTKAQRTESEKRYFVETDVLLRVGVCFMLLIESSLIRSSCIFF